MNIDELSYEQKVMLVGLVEAIALSDGYVGEGEQKEIGKIAETLGESEYRRLLDEAENRYASVEDLKEALLTVKDQEARECIYGLALEETLADVSIGEHKQTQLLEWLNESWAISEQSTGGE